MKFLCTVSIMLFLQEICPFLGNKLINRVIRNVIVMGQGGLLLQTTFHKDNC